MLIIGYSQEYYFHLRKCSSQSNSKIKLTLDSPRSPQEQRALGREAWNHCIQRQWQLESRLFRKACSNSSISQPEPLEDFAIQECFNVSSFALTYPKRQEVEGQLCVETMGVHDVLVIWPAIRASSFAEKWSVHVCLRLISRDEMPS